MKHDSDNSDNNDNDTNNNDDNNNSKGNTIFQKEKEKMSSTCKQKSFLVF